ncbi:MAG: flagellar hook protein FlgE [Candidatus Sumerlaeota bacterium]|nr:flagellar hook protein FlgE [Candidatus Sumerlaeota bacterium]
MGIISAMYAGVTGVKSFSTAIQVIGSNLANSNTVGYKAVRVQFSDLLSQNLAGSLMGGQVGRGVTVAGTSRDYSQGTFSSTSVNTDVAIQGAGWFKMTDGGQDYYTRDGAFQVDKDGYLVGSTGYKALGFQYDIVGNPTTQTGAINLSNLVNKPNATTKVTVGANLDAGATTPATAWDAQNPATTSNFSTSIRVYDSLGKDHEISVFFRKTGANTWNWYGLAATSDVDPSAAGYNAANAWYQAANGSLSFTNAGALDTETTAANAFNFAGGASLNQQMAFDFGTSITTDGGKGLDGTTQFASPSVVSFQNQDGYAAGNLVSVAISADGVIQGAFSNGRMRNVARIGLACFTAEQGLRSMGSGLFQETPQSGQPTFLTPGAGPAGTLTANALEQSNVDIANEFVQMIQNQRAYQANTRTITVSDQLLSDTVNLIR